MRRERDRDRGRGRGDGEKERGRERMSELEKREDAGSQTSFLALGFIAFSPEKLPPKLSDNDPILLQSHFLLPLQRVKAGPLHSLSSLMPMVLTPK